MVCCEADITFLGMMARGDLEQFEEREWIEVTANADVVKHPAYDTGDGPVLDILTAARCDRPAEDVVSF